MGFDLGIIVNTIGVHTFANQCLEHYNYVMRCFERYINCDWGEMCEEDKIANDEAINNEDRILASYEEEGMPKIWIITEWDRSATTILFPSEY